MAHRLEIMTDDLLFKIAARKETCKPHPSPKLPSLCDSNRPCRFTYNQVEKVRCGGAVFHFPKNGGLVWNLVIADDVLKGPCDAVGFNIFPV
jgi:hypothetical protein